MPVYVYGLIENGRSVSEFRYVGIAESPKQRLAQHRATNEETDKGEWIAGLRSENRTVDMVILGEVEDRESAHAIENAWIIFGRKRGWQLTNSTNPSDYRDILSPDFGQLVDAAADLESMRQYIRASDEEHRRQLLLIAENHKVEMDSVTNEHHNRLQMAITEYKRQIDEANNKLETAAVSHNRELQELRLSRDGAMQEMQFQHNTAMIEIECKHKAEVESLKLEHDRTIRLIVTNHEKDSKRRYNLSVWASSVIVSLTMMAIIYGLFEYPSVIVSQRGESINMAYNAFAYWFTLAVPILFGWMLSIVFRSIPLYKFAIPDHLTLGQLNQSFRGWWSQLNETEKGATYVLARTAIIAIVCIVAIPAA